MTEESTGSNPAGVGAPGRPRLLDQVHDTIRRKYYSRRTEEAYVHWIKRFIYFTGKRHPGSLGEPEVTAFLSHLAVKLHVAAATQNQALSALLFLYKEVLGQELGWLDGVQRATRPPRLPTVLTHEDVERLLACMVGTRWLLASLLYGAGLRLMECLRLRVKDVDFGYGQILVRDGKGAKDRATMLPRAVIEPLTAYLERVRALHNRDLAAGYGEVWLPHALDRKYPRAAREWGWQYIFPSRKLSTDPRSGAIRRHHLDEDVLQRAVKEAARLADVRKPVSCHAFRHSFATHLLEAGYDIPPLEIMMPDQCVTTTCTF
jgi:integron integrase